MEKLIREYFLCWRTTVRIQYQNLRNEWLDFLLCFSRKNYLSLNNSIHYLFYVFASKGRNSEKYFIKEHSKTPNICFRWLLFSCKDFQCHILMCPTQSSSVLILLVLSTPSKIAKFKIIIFINQNILWLYIPVHESQRVHIVYSQNGLVEVL